MGAARGAARGFPSPALGRDPAVRGTRNPARVDGPGRAAAERSLASSVSVRVRPSNTIGSDKSSSFPASCKINQQASALANMQDVPQRSLTQRQLHCDPRTLRRA